MHKALITLVGAILFTHSAQAQKVFALPGAGSGGNTVSVYAADPLLSIMNIFAGSGAFLVLEQPDGSYSIFSSSGASANSLSIVDSSLQNQRTIGNFSQQPTLAVPLPDGIHIAVL